MKIKDRSFDYLLKIVSKYYLRKPDQAELLKIKYKTPGSLTKGFMNELFFRFGRETGFQLVTVNLELTNLCNLKCSICPLSHDMKRATGFMEYSLFKKIVDENPELDFILLFQWGEPLLHRDLFKMIKYAKAAGIRSMMTTNGVILGPVTTRKLLNSGLERITFSIDGTEETYNSIRGVPLEKIRKNIIRFRNQRDKAGSDTAIDVSMVVCDETLGHIEEFKREWAGIADRVQYIPVFIKGRRREKCRELWRGSLVVLWDGTVVPCCVDYNGIMKVGDAKEQSLQAIWRGVKMRNLRTQHIQGKLPQVCSECDEYSMGNIELSKRFRK
jgi:radical SAM protein with 4Fe4S-binding SPASM domain